MSNSNPTPGPWQADVSHNSQLIFAQTDSEDEHVVTRVNSNALLEGDWRANARLIAAAGTAAQEVMEMGYDAVAVMENLPLYLNTLEEVARANDLTKDQHRTLARGARASAEGSGE